MNIRHSWVASAETSDFSLDNLPYGVFRSEGEVAVGVAIGDEILNLGAVAALGFLDQIVEDRTIFARDTVNDFIALGSSVWSKTRARLQQLLSADNTELSAVCDQVLIPRIGTELLLPIAIGDYTDFYSSIHHATNVGKLFRPDNPLFPNWRHLPVGYHGRASSVVVSGTEIVRPCGQVLPAGEELPRFQPTAALDIELELAFIVGATTKLGERIPVSEAEHAIFGVALFNDWSARDIQKWEYVPLGPFLGKSFASSMAPWIVPFAALEPFRIQGPTQEPAPLPYLREEGAHHFSIDLEVTINTAEGAAGTVCRTNASTLYWSMAQQLAHHTSNGCNVRVGDLMASGTISGSEPGSYGCLLEATHGGKVPLTLSHGVQRTYLKDGDTVTITGRAERGGVRIGLGEVVGIITGAR